MWFDTVVPRARRSKDARMLMFKLNFNHTNKVFPLTVERGDFYATIYLLRFCFSSWKLFQCNTHLSVPLCLISFNRYCLLVFCNFLAKNSSNCSTLFHVFYSSSFVSCNFLSESFQWKKC